jgi:hypothetical protein
MKELNIKILNMIQEWDPFKTATMSNDAEAADVIQLAHQSLGTEDLAKRIKEVYDHSFEVDMSFQECLVLARNIQNLFNDTTCDL